MQTKWCIELWKIHWRGGPSGFCRWNISRNTFMTGFTNAEILVNDRAV